MAQIVITANTTDKKIDVKVDDKKVDNVRSIFMDAEDSGFGFAVDISIVEEAGENLKKVTRLVANEKGELVDRPSNIKEDVQKWAANK